MIRTKDGHFREWMFDSSAKSGRKWFYGKTRAEVLEKMKKWESKRPSAHSSFEVVASAWWEQIEPTLAENTKKGYRPAMSRAVKYLPENIADIKPRDVQNALQMFIKVYAPAQKTVTTLLQVIRQILQYAVVNGYVEYNAAREVAVPRNLAKKKVAMPSAEDIRRVKESLDIEGGRLAYWALYTGMRRGELLALTWEDVDLARRVIRVNKSIYHDHNRPRLKTPKTASGTREIPIVDKLYQTIKKRGKGAVFGGLDGEYMTASYAFDYWKRYQKESGVTCTLHQLRHAFATMLFEADVPARDAMNVLGHAQYSTTMDIYTDIRKERERITAEKMNGIDL